MDTSSQTVNDRPLVSILMLAYNRADYVGEAIRSVLAQTYEHWKLSIIDDGSTDATPQVVAGFGDPRIAYIRDGEHRGLFARRKESFERATGTYVAVLDHDDVWHAPEKLGRQVAFMEAHPDCAVVGTFVRLIDADGRDIGIDTFATTDGAIRKRMLLRNQLSHSSVLMRRSMLEKTQGYQDTLAEDFELFLQLGQHGAFANLPEILTSHRVLEGSANDRGTRMAAAVQAIVKKYRGRYPNGFLGLLRCWMRTAKARAHALF